MKKKEKILMIAYNVTHSYRDPSVRFWNKIGIGFINRDGSINVKLDSFPINPRCGEFQLRPADKCFPSKDKGERVRNIVPDPDPFNGEPYVSEDMPF